MKKLCKSANVNPDKYFRRYRASSAYGKYVVGDIKNALPFQQSNIICIM